MTYGELFTQVLAEITGKPEEQIVDLLAQFRAANPGDNFDKEIDPDKAKALLEQTRRNPEAIKTWLGTGYSKVMKKLGHA